MIALMLIHDRIYGEVNIFEPVLLDLLASNAVQRLQAVLQHGVTGLIGITAETSRYEHSLGVMLLVRQLGADLEEQIAALLHDVSHTAFSHVIDYVFNNHEAQGFHDEHKAEYVAASDIPAILAQHNYDWCTFVCLDDEAIAQRFPLLEQPSPALCADRLDYFLRDSLDLGLATPGQVQKVLEHVTVFDGRMVFDDLATARWAAETYIAADELSWANFREVGLYELAARAIRRALNLGLLVESDLWGTDRVLWQRIQAADDEHLQAELALVTLDTRFVWDEARPDFSVSTKLRTIDPPVLLDGRALPLSAHDDQYARRRQAYLAGKAGSWPMRVIPG